MPENNNYKYLILIGFVGFFLVLLLNNSLTWKDLDDTICLWLAGTEEKKTWTATLRSEVGSRMNTHFMSHNDLQSKLINKDSVVSSLSPLSSFITASTKKWMNSKSNRNDPHP